MCRFNESVTFMIKSGVIEIDKKDIYSSCSL